VQLRAVQRFGNANEVQVQTATCNPSLDDFTDGATALGIVIALSVLAMSVGLIRSQTAPDLRTLTAAGASGVPVTDIVILLIGLPMVAAIGGWLSAGREPPAVARQPIE
jgi:putative ABC transport system permease protein